MRGIVCFAAAASLTVSLGQPASAAEHGDSTSAARQASSDESEHARSGGSDHKKRCQLDNSIERVVYIQFDNVHFRRDNPNVPSDLEQMPNLLNFLEDKGTLFTNHFTPLISHTAVDILTSLTGSMATSSESRSATISGCSTRAASQASRTPSPTGPI